MPKYVTVGVNSRRVETTLGTWTAGPAKLTASYHNETTVRVDVEGRSRVLTEREWLEMWDNIRDAGYTRAA